MNRPRGQRCSTVGGIGHACDRVGKFDADVEVRGDVMATVLEMPRIQLVESVRSDVAVPIEYLETCGTQGLIGDVEQPLGVI